jgi:hypothetical protein
MPRTDLARAAATVKAAAKGPLDQKSSIVPELSGPGGGLPGWSHFMPDEREVAERWKGRRRIETVEEMLNHFQVAACWQAIRLPTHRYIVELDPMDCDPVVVDLIASDLDVPLKGGPDEQRPGRRANRFSERRHRDRAIDGGLPYGHAVFEQAGRIDQAGDWRLTDLAPVPQWTISDPNSWEIDRHGRLIKVIQHGCTPPVEIPVDHLVTFTWQGAPGDPRGRSVLRPLTAAFVMHDRTMRVMGMSAERTGMGIPVGRVPTGAVLGAKEKMSALLAGLAAGHDTNLVLETDEDIHKSLMLMGVTGQTPDLVGMLKYYDEAIARATLAMVIQLGQTATGSRALGGTFDDLLAMYHDAVIDWYCDVMTEQLVEPWIDRNRGEDAPAPRLVWRRRDDAGAPAPGGSAEAVAPAQPTPAVAATRRAPTAAARHERRAKAARAAFATVAGRDLRRDPTEAELAAATDFAQLEQHFVTARDDLAAVLLRDRDELAQAAVDAIAGLTTVDPLTLGATLGPLLEEHAAGMDTGPLVTILTAAADRGVQQVVGEAARQGVTLTASIDYEARAEGEARDLLRRMAVQVTETAAAAVRVSVPVQAARGRLRDRLRPARLATVEADFVAEQLATLTAARAEEAAAGAASRANGTGRYAAMDVAPVQRCYVSALLDQAACDPCVSRDGEEFASVAEAQAEFPYGPNPACEGMERCRCTIVAVMEGEV